MVFIGNAQNPLHTFPRNFPVVGEATNLLYGLGADLLATRPTSLQQVGVMDCMYFFNCSTISDTVTVRKRKFLNRCAQSDSVFMQGFCCTTLIDIAFHLSVVS